MNKLDDKRKFRKILYSKITLFFLLIVLFFSIRATYRVYEKEKESNANLAIAERRFDDLNARNATLRKDIERLSSARGVEEEIRQKFRVAKPGEELALIVEPDKGAAELSPIENESWWTKFLHWIW